MCERITFMKENERPHGGEHEACFSELSAYIDGELDGTEEARVRSHIEECPACREIYERLVLLSGKIKNACPEIPRDLHERIMSAVRNESGKKKRGIQDWSRLLHRHLLPIGAGAVAVICLVLVGSPVFRSGFSMKNGRAAEAMDISQGEAIAEFEAYSIDTRAASPDKYSFDITEEKTVLNPIQTADSECEGENFTSVVGFTDCEITDDSPQSEEIFVPSFFPARGKLDIKKQE